jgi:hypothetical protein
VELQDLMRDRFTDVIERATGRPVIGFMSGNQLQDDLRCEVFLLRPTDPVGAQELSGASGGSPGPA